MQKSKKPKCTICNTKIKAGIVCDSCNRLLGEGYEKDDILRYYHKDSKKYK